MDLYDISFFLTTLWVGPFWLAMLIYPDEESTKKLLKGPMFFLGPILIWIFLTLLEPQGLVELIKGFTNPLEILDEIAVLIGTKAGAAAVWAHMVAGDIFATRWMWKRSLRLGFEKWKTTVVVFFGVMLMPIGVFLYVIFSKNVSVSE
tara:strand:+ start:1164 stop:1607 length:444 start_codon:yes stop_codon:yes gene_type:complete